MHDAELVEEQPKTETRHSRARGLIFLAIGLTLAKWQIYNPLHALERGEHEITIYSTAIAFAVLLPMLGAVFLIFGSEADRLFSQLAVDPKRLSGKNIAMLIGFALLFLALWIGIQLKLSAQGFQ